MAPLSGLEEVKYSTVVGGALYGGIAARQGSGCISKNQLFLFHLIPSYYILFLLFWG